MDILENRSEWQAAYTEGWLREYQQTGIANWKLYQRPRNSAPIPAPGIDLSASRLVLISSAGGYLPTSQPAYDTDNDLGDYTIRLIPTASPLEDIAYAHTHYNHTAVDQDAQVLVPLRHLEDLVREGVIGTLTDSFISFMGYQPDVTRVLDETIPAVIAAVKAEQADAALLVPS